MYFKSLEQTVCNYCNVTTTTTAHDSLFRRAVRRRAATTVIYGFQYSQFADFPTYEISRVPRPRRGPGVNNSSVRRGNWWFGPVKRACAHVEEGDPWRATDRGHGVPRGHGSGEDEVDLVSRARELMSRPRFPLVGSIYHKFKVKG